MTTTEETLKALREEAERLQEPYGTHGFEHTLRVYEDCARLGAKLKADMSILLPSALLHDIARSEENHAEAGAGIAARILERHGFDPRRVILIREVIRSHSFTAGLEAASLEARILSDADKLDALGAVGIYRAAAFSGEVKRPLEAFEAHFHEKLLRLGAMLYTVEARRIAEGRLRHMELYLEQLHAELRGER